MMKPTYRMFLLILLLFAGAGCNLLSPLSARNTPDPASTYVIQTAQGELFNNVTVTVSPTVIPSGMGQCGYTWATERLPEQSAKLQTSLDAGGFSGVKGRAEAFGENCVRQDGTLDHFSAMQTDFHFTVPAADLNNREALGEQVGKLVELLAAFPAGSFPGPNKGYVGIEFNSGDQNLNMWFKLDDAQRALADGKRGADLFKSLRPEG
jgi:hypothetical protein